MLQHSDFIFAVIAPDSRQLLAFARVLTDRAFKALVLDVIVHPAHRSAGLGSFLMAHITAHPILSRVRHIELGEVRFMRRTHEPQPNGNA